MKHIWEYYCVDIANEYMHFYILSVIFNYNYMVKPFLLIDDISEQFDNTKCKLLCIDVGSKSHWMVTKFKNWITAIKIMELLPSSK